MFGSMTLLGICLSLLLSCRKHTPETALRSAKAFEPQNLYPVERLPVYFNRVVVLPAFIEGNPHNLTEYIDEVFSKQLSKEGIFEIVRLSESSCMKLFGQKRLSSSQNLQEDFLSILEYETGANGVLFIDLHSFSPYRPMSIGVRSKLVDLKSGDFVWAIDETFDVGNISVLAGAQQFQGEHVFNSLSQKTKGSVSQSPRAFCHYVAHTLFKTLPRR